MSGEKTEEPTAQKLRKARERGEVPKSRELGTAAVLLATGGALLGTSEHALATLRAALSTFLQNAPSMQAGQPALELGLGFGLDVLVPILLAALLAGTVTGYLQVGGLLTVHPLLPKLERIDPVRGAKNLFNQRRLVELLKTLLMMGVVGYVAFGVLRDGVRGVSGLAARDASAALSATGHLASSLLFRVAGAVLGLAILDVLYQRWRHRRDQRMSKDEVKREYKESEGDPHAKSQRERLHRELVEHDTVESVRSADVVVVNPTHVAVALRYDDETMDAPEVVARGQEHLAQRMIAAAHESGVPVMRDVPLARALHRLELGEQVPERLFEAVAAVLKAAWAERERLEGAAERSEGGAR